MTAAPATPLRHVPRAAATPAGARVWAEVDLGALRRNLRTLAAPWTPGVRALAVLKANAYGHGALACARALVDSGDTCSIGSPVAFLGIGDAGEARELRDGGITAPILMLGTALLEELPELVALDVVPSIATPEHAFALQSILEGLGRDAYPVHLLVDTGMHRHGVLPGEIGPLLAALDRCPRLVVEGVYTHFSTAAEPDRGFSHRQLGDFVDLLHHLRREGIDPPWVHAASSAAAANYEGARFTLVRLGLSLYGSDPGFWPPPPLATDPGAPTTAPRAGTPRLASIGALDPVLHLRARAVAVRSLPAGTPMSYDRTHYLARDTRVATLAVGYADGVPRRLSGVGYGLAQGRRCSIIGRVTMDYTLVDVSALPAFAVGDTVTLIGRDLASEQVIRAADIAALTGAIPYEVTCALGGRVRRAYSDGPA